MRKCNIYMHIRKHGEIYTSNAFSNIPVFKLQIILNLMGKIYIVRKDQNYNYINNIFLIINVRTANQ